MNPQQPLNYRVLTRDSEAHEEKICLKQLFKLFNTTKGLHGMNITLHGIYIALESSCNI